MVLVRYITREITYIFLGVITVLIFIAISNQFVRYLAKAASGQLPIGFVFKIIVLYIPEFFSILAPVSLFIAILFTLGRLHTDSEIHVLFASGFSWADIIKIILKIAVIIALIIFYLTIFLIPHITKYREQLIADGKILGSIYGASIGQFQVLNDGKLVVYAENFTADKNLQRIFIANHNDEIVTAKLASIKQINPNENNFYMILQNGQRYVGLPGEADHMAMSFTEYGREINYEPEPVPVFQKTAPTKKLIYSNLSSDKAELQWRLSMPSAVIILALLAIPLAKISPRAGKYARFLPGIILYISYYNCLILIRHFMTDENILPWQGLWIVHGVFLIIAILLLMKISGRMSQFFYYIKNLFEFKNKS